MYPSIGAINSQRQTGVQRAKDQRQLLPPDRTEDEGPTSNPVDTVRAGCEGPTSNSALPAFPLGHSPCNRDHAPRFLWSETLEKAKQCSHYYPARNRLGIPCRVCLPDIAQSVRFGSTKLQLKFASFAQ